MLSKQHRLTRKEVDGVLQQGRFFRSVACSMRVLPSPFTKVAVSVSKKTAKTAVARNYIRRSVFSFCKKFDRFTELKYHVVFVVHTSNLAEVERDIHHNLSLLTK